MRSVNLGRWSRRVERYFNMKGGGGLMDVDQAIQVCLPIASGTEERYLEGWDRYGWQPPVTGGAGQNPAAMLRNPAGSNTVMVIEKITVMSTGGAADSPLLQRSGPAAVDLTTIVSLSNNRMPDSRNRSSPTAIASTSTNAAQLGITLARATYAQNGSYDFIQTVNQEITLTPDNAIQIFGPTVAATINVNFWWRERSLEASELT